MNTVTCPACGASATNLKNCNYCGSLFVRYADNDFQADFDSLFDENQSFKGFTFLGLEEELRKNISLQTEKSFIVTEVYGLNGSCLLQIVQSNASSVGHSNPIFPGVTIHIPFEEGNGNDYESFLKLEESGLFTRVQEDEFNTHVIDFGNDPIGAAYLASIILGRVMGVAKSSTLTYNTRDFTSSNPENGSWCFIATATMGSYDHPEVIELRRFRDNWLLKKPWGRSFTKYYYRYGSYPAKFIENKKLFKKISYYLVIKPLLFIVRNFT